MVHERQLPPGWTRSARPRLNDGSVADQPLLPPEVQGETFYEPTDRGFEAELRERLEAIRKRRRGK